ncbi:hypothetical protein [Capillimicrobium parvum]|uniref:Uncharacterized protein n=1 Tax=Capillimicrobium parvum TaxID=2884022 RepID=A0A9E7C2R4_9ACTN|nr:hypothetical protein [Capillimicrobium parvum]UGS38716.1 hypothetical protein DSM104329_05146 [Capillimicrobium parvum]
MAPASTIEGLDPRFFRPCIFAMLRELDYGTRATVNNGVSSGPHATPMLVSMSAWDAADGRHIGTTEAFDRLEPGEIRKFDADGPLGTLPDVPAGDVLAVVHVVPEAMAGRPAVDAGIAAMQAHVLASDDFIEYYQRPKGVVTGVAYQTGPLNDTRLSSTRSTVCQAPKVIVSDPVDTLFLLMNVSTSFGYADPVRMDYWILGADGSRVARSHVEVPPFTFRLVSATEALEHAGKLEEYRAGGGLGMFLGLSRNGTLVPISLTRNKVTGAIACDHTLPPKFYLSTWGGEPRHAANARLEAEFFADVPAPQPAGAAAP